MITHPTLFVMAGLVALLASILIGGYWAIFYPVFRRTLCFRTESLLDRLQLLALAGDVPHGNDLYRRLHGFVKDAFEATTREDWITMRVVSDEDYKDRKIRIEALWKEMDDINGNLRDILEETTESLAALYLAQRPMMICAYAPLVGFSIFVGRAKRSAKTKEIDFAAGMLAA